MGQKGSRIRAIVDELKGEMIDVIKWSSNPEEYIASSLSPAKVVRVDTDEEQKVARVIVPDFQLSLAIGKEGQNARLAAKLTGWKIDIKSESQLRAHIEQQLFTEDSEIVFSKVAGGELDNVAESLFVENDVSGEPQTSVDEGLDTESESLFIESDTIDETEGLFIEVNPDDELDDQLIDDAEHSGDTDI